MEKFTSKVGNTIELTVDAGIDGVVTEVELEIFTDYIYPDGPTGSVMVKVPDAVEAGEHTFVFDTDAIITSAGKIYMHFRAKKDGMKINDYFQVSFKY